MSIKLLTKQSAKINKSQNDATLNYILYLDPLFKGSVCPSASAGCRKSCLINSGRMAMDNAKQARNKRTALYYDNPEVFFYLLRSEIDAAVKSAKRQNKKLALRLNGTSDLDFTYIYKLYPEVQFYEYTKRPDLAKILSRLDNVHVTFSRHENHTTDDIASILDAGVNVAVVFKDAVPTNWQGFDVIDGDAHDRRYEDVSGKIVGLKLKGTKAAKAHAIKRGFAI